MKAARVSLHTTALTSVPDWISAAPLGQVPARAGLVGGQDLGRFTSASKLFSVTGISALTRLSPEIHPVLASSSVLEEGVGVAALFLVLRVLLQLLR